MSTEQKAQNESRYYSLIEGTFRTKVDKDHPEAKRRDWEAKGDRPAGFAYERAVQALFGKVENIYFHKGDYGRKLNLVLDKDEDGKNPVISVPQDQRYGESLLKILPMLEPGVEYRFAPYDFIPENGGSRKVGVSVAKRDDEGEFTLKLKSPFFGEDGQYLEGYPAPTEEDKEDWKFYYTKANKFMVKYAEDKVLPKFAGVSEKTEEETTYPENDLGPVGF